MNNRGKLTITETPAEPISGQALLLELSLIHIRLGKLRGKVWANRELEHGPKIINRLQQAELEIQSIAGIVNGQKRVA